MIDQTNPPEYITNGEGVFGKVAKWDGDLFLDADEGMWIEITDAISPATKEEYDDYKSKI